MNMIWRSSQPSGRQRLLCLKGDNLAHLDLFRGKAKEIVDKPFISVEASPGYQTVISDEHFI